MPPSSWYSTLEGIGDDPHSTLTRSAKDAWPVGNLPDTPPCHAPAMTGWTRGELLGFDLETTGIDRFSDVPVSYALVRVEGAQVVQRDTWLVDPGREIPDGATAIHGI